MVDTLSVFCRITFIYVSPIPVRVSNIIRLPSCRPIRRNGPAVITGTSPQCAAFCPPHSVHYPPPSIHHIRWGERVRYTSTNKSALVVQQTDSGVHWGIIFPRLYLAGTWTVIIRVHLRWIVSDLPAVTCSDEADPLHIINEKV